MRNDEWEVVWETVKASWISAPWGGKAVEATWRSHLDGFDPSTLIDAIRVESEAVDRPTVKGLVATYWTEHRNARLSAESQLKLEAPAIPMPDFNARYAALDPERREQLEQRIKALYPSAYEKRNQGSAWLWCWQVLVCTAYSDPEGTRRRLDATAARG